jgi:hypothetical protein
MKYFFRVKYTAVGEKSLFGYSQTRLRKIIETLEEGRAGASGDRMVQPVNNTSGRRTWRNRTKYTVTLDHW